MSVLLSAAVDIADGLLEGVLLRPSPTPPATKYQTRPVRLIRTVPVLVRRWIGTVGNRVSKTVLHRRAVSDVWPAHRRCVDEASGRRSQSHDASQSSSATAYRR